jgi:SAM-dependent methyltransferase
MDLNDLKTHLISYIPLKLIGTGGTDNARYCYSVWLRHLVLLKSQSNDFEIPKVVAELGPGDSIGIGIAALISGVDKYYALDVVKFANPKRNLHIFNELVELFKKRDNIPSKKEFPNLHPYLNSYDFPNHIFTDDHLKIMLNEDRLNRIKNAIIKDEKLEDNLNIDNKDTKIVYAVPWNQYDISINDSVDLIYSQAVLEHVDDLEDTYQQMYRWLKPGGFMSHVIDFKCHGTSKKWNGHWTYSDFMWNFIRGRRNYLLNREPFSTHINLLKKNKFTIINIKKVTDFNGLKIENLNYKFNFLTDEDLCTSSVLIQSTK